MPPITIHNNTIDPNNTKPGYLPPDAADTSFILLQTTHPPDSQESCLLNAYGVKFLQLVDNNNTFLCRYEPSDLKVLEALPFVQHALVYHPDFVIHPLLKGVDLKNPPDFIKVERPENENEKGPHLCEVNITLHDDTTEDGDDVFDLIESNLPEDMRAMKVMSDENHLRVLLPLDSLAHVAALDQVLAIHPAVDELPQLVKARALLQQGPAFFSDYPPPWYSAVWSLLNHRSKYTGSGETVAVADTGMSKGVGPNAPEHPAFTGRIANTDDRQRIRSFNQTLEDTSKDSHGTHVAGCVAGWEKHQTETYQNSSHISGTAPMAKIFVQKYTDPSDTPWAWGKLALNMTRSCPEAKIHNNSTSPSASLDNIQKGYDFNTRAKEVDTFSIKNPAYLVVFGAGNDGDIITSGPRGTPNTGNDIVFNRQISGASASKNALTVGATWNARDMAMKFPGNPAENDPGDGPPDFQELHTYEGDPRALGEFPPMVFGYGREPPRTICSFSSKGPTTKNLLKPDIVAPGCGILSAASLHPTYQAKKAKIPEGEVAANSCVFPDMVFLSGTSMSCPQVAGLAACLREAAVKKGFNILGSTLRAILVNGAVSCAGQKMLYANFSTLRGHVAEGMLGDPPDCIQGFGQASYRRSILHVEQASLRTVNGYGPIGFHQAGDRVGDGITITGFRWPDDLPTDALRASSYIRPGRNNGQLRVTLAYNDLFGDTLQHRLDLFVQQQGVTTTTNPPQIRNIGAPRAADPITTYTEIDFPLQPAERIVTFGTIQKVTWKNINPGVLNPGEVMQFQMRVVAVARSPRTQTPVQFSLAWVSSANDDF